MNKVTIEKFKKGTLISVGEENAQISTDVISADKKGDISYIVAEIIKTVPGGKLDKSICCTKKIDEKTALIMRNKEKMLEIGLNKEERKCIYCHELGHCFSQNQKDKPMNTLRNIEDEVDSDNFAVKMLGISPFVLESSLKKTINYHIANFKKRNDLTKEEVEEYIVEMTERTKNARNLIKEFKKEITR